MMTFTESRRLHYLEVLTILIFVGSFSVGIAQIGKGNEVKYSALNCRKHSASLTDFGGVGDGKTLNTKAFQAAIANLSKYANDGGAELVVPAGKWLTGSFNLTSHFTLFLHKDATILASQNEADYPLTAPLPSYGIEKNFTNGRFTSLIHGTNLTDVVITGNNGSIDGQGAPWWDKFANGTMKAWRPFLIELMYTTNLQISSITLRNAPFWNIHPVYSSNIVIQSVTIIAPVDIPNTDGINPNSCSNVRIEDCYIVSGDDCIAVKSGWDQYGIKFGMPTKDVIIRRLTCISPDSAAIALGSEMSGGIQNVRIEDLTGINTQSGIRIKTAPGRGGYVKDIFARRMTYSIVPHYIFWISGAYKSHPDDGYDPNALAEITNINFRDIVAENVTTAASLNGFAGHPFTGICISNTTIKTLHEDAKFQQWNCTDVQGVISNVAILQYPCFKTCKLLTEKANTVCAFPEDKLPIESVQLNACSAKGSVP